jgi:hypothetical protein
MTYRTKLNLTDGLGIHNILWITEEDSSRYPGISNGFYGKLGNTHYTYHDNGLNHEVIRRLAGSNKEMVNEFMRVPIDDIKQCIQIHFQAIPVRGSELKLLSSKDNSSRIYNKILTLNINDFADGLSISTHILRKGCEDIFLYSITKSFLDTSKLISIELIDLAYHQNHRLGIVLLSPSVPQSA